MAEIAAVVFDLDDTLHAERRFVLSGLRHVADLIEAEHGVPAGNAWRAAVGAFRRGPRCDVFQAVCRRTGLPAHDVPRWIEAFRTHKPAVRLCADAVSTLRTLRADGRRLAVLTNGPVAVQQGKVAALGLDNLVDLVVYADAVAPGGKPDVRCFAAVAQRLGTPASALVMVGNAPAEDVAGARASGWRSVLLDRRGVVPACGADAVIRRLRDVPATIRQLERGYARAC